MKNWIYRWLPIIFGCHCRDDRSFYIGKEKFPICARCTGELVGIIVSIFSCFFYVPSVYVLILMMIPMLVDGFLQLKTKYTSNNAKRFVTGFLFGYALIAIHVVIFISVYEFGISIGAKL